MSTALYTGPLVRKLGGADISWILGLLVTGGVYYFVSRRTHRGRDQQGSAGGFA